ncbi:MAG: DUF3149 domain-containing protein [Betaproteobacteria bacterium]|nr:DUF3149 domain-containing protein [Betaproteobacteria bacterium]
MLLTTDYGLLSLIVILFILVMAGYFSWYFKKKMDEDQKAAKK